jgi:hypothetical protein
MSAQRLPPTSSLPSAPEQILDPGGLFLLLYPFSRLMSLLVKWAKYIIEDVNVTNLNRNVTSQIRTSGSFRRIHIYELISPRVRSLMP